MPIYGRLSNMERISNCKNLYLFCSGVFIIVLSAFLIYYVQWRWIDYDEGFYLAVSQLVAQGKTVYRDFFYPQTPLMPYFYAPICWIKPSLIALRLFSATLTILMVVLWNIYLRREYDETPGVALASLILLALNPQMISWNITVKTYALANFFITATLFSLYIALHAKKHRYYALSGAFFSLTFSVRLLYMPIGIVIVLWLFANEYFKEKRYIFSYSFLIGLAIGSIPFLLFFISDPKKFLFNNIGYHLIRNKLPPPPLLSHIIYSLSTFTMIVKVYPYLAITILIALIGFFSLVRQKELNSFIFMTALISVVFVIISLSPYPIYEEYFNATLGPLLLPLFGSGLLMIYRMIYKMRHLLILGLILFLSLLSYETIKVEENQILNFTHYDVSQYLAISEYIKRHSNPNDVILSFWPGYVFESGRRFFPDMENQFGLSIGGKLSAKERKDYHIANKYDIFLAIQRQAIKMVILQKFKLDWFGFSNIEETEFYRILQEKYILMKQFGFVGIYQPK